MGISCPYIVSGRDGLDPGMKRFPLARSRIWFTLNERNDLVDAIAGEPLEKYIAQIHEYRHAIAFSDVLKKSGLRSKTW